MFFVFKQNVIAIVRVQMDLIVIIMEDVLVCLISKETNVTNVRIIWSISQIANVLMVSLLLKIPVLVRKI